VRAFAPGRFARRSPRQRLGTVVTLPTDAAALLVPQRASPRHTSTSAYIDLGASTAIFELTNGTGRVTAR
jgi:hypothetical protein